MTVQRSAIVLLSGVQLSICVVIDLFLMSQCPDAFHCENAILPALEKLGPLVELRLGFIAEFDPSEPTGFRCAHGRGECEGNIAQLCVQKHFPTDIAIPGAPVLSPAHRWTRFLLCVGGTMHSNFSAIPGNTDECLSSLGVPRSTRRAIRQCADGREGRELHMHSMQRTHSTCGHEAMEAHQPCTSCQIFVEGEPSCAVDWGNWFNCSDPSPQGWVRRVCEAAQPTVALPEACLTGRQHQARDRGKVTARGRGGLQRTAQLEEL